VTPEDGLDATVPIRTNVVSQSLVLTRTMDYWGARAASSVSIVVPYLSLESSRIPTAPRSEVCPKGFLWQMNIFGGPALTREAFAFSLLFTGAGFAGARQSKRCIHSAARTPSGAGVRGK
jgi:hypothetical protein